MQSILVLLGLLALTAPLRPALAIPTTDHKLQDADKAVVSRVDFAAHHKAIELLMCTAEECNKLAVNGAATGGAMSYSFYTGCNAQGAGHCHLNRTISPIDNKPLSAGPVQFVTMRLPKLWAVWLDGHLRQALVLPAPVCSDKLKIKPAHGNDMPVSFSTVKTEKFEKEDAYAGLELPSSAKVIADTLVEIITCS